MYRKIPTVLTAEELLDKAFKKANKIHIDEKDRVWREKRITEDRLNCIGDTISTKLHTYIRTFPSLNKRESFEEALVDLVVDGDRMKRSLGALSWASKTIMNMAQEGKSKAKKERRDPEVVASIRKKYYGKIAGIMHKMDKELRYLAEAREKLKQLPSIDPELPTAVVAGAPNVGKSKIVTHLSTAHPEVASYPFTTKQIHVGMFEYRHLRYQVLDTPGLLDRPLEERNDIERQAILALKHLPHLVVFVLDPTEECGTSLQEQKHLYQAIKENFGRTQHILIYNKTDLMEPPEGEIGVSALTGAGIENLREEIARRLAPIHLERDPVESYQG